MIVLYLKKDLMRKLIVTIEYYAQTDMENVMKYFIVILTFGALVSCTGSDSSEGGSGLISKEKGSGNDTSVSGLSISKDEVAREVASELKASPYALQKVDLDELLSEGVINQEEYAELTALSNQ
jgi:hypothetical protein